MSKSSALVFTRAAVILLLTVTLVLVQCYDKRIFDASLPLEQFTTEAGANISLACPGVNEHSLVQDLEWRYHHNHVKLVQYIGQSTTVWEHRHRISLLPGSFALHFHPVTASDSGEYICLFNSNPKPEAIVKLIVQDVPEPPGRPLIMGFTSRSVNLSWAPSQDTHHSPITHYIIHTRVGEDGDWSIMDGILTKDNSTSYQLTKLHPYTVYSFRVLAVNAMGASVPSKESYYMVTLREVPAGKPTITTAHNTSSTSLHISWRPPHHDTIHGEFLGYRIAYRPRDRSPNSVKEIYIRDSNVESHTIQDLETYTQYLVSLQVFNPEGLGPSTTVLVMTDEGVPSKPLNLTVLGVKKDSISLSWLAPEHANGAITGYRIYYMHSNYTEVQSPRLQLAASSIQYVLTGLLSNMEYKIWVKAFTQKNEGDSSDPVQCTTDISSPSAPQILNVTCQSQDTLFVQWRKPQDFMHKIAYYMISYRPEYSYAFEEIKQPNCGLTECHVSISNLTVDTMYEVRVKGVSMSKIHPDQFIEGIDSDSRKVCMRENCDKILPHMHSSDHELSAGMIAGLICAIFASLMAITSLILWRKCFHAAYYYLDDPVCAPIASTADWESAPRCTVLGAGTDEDGNTMSRGGAIPVHAFADHVASLHADGDIGFSKEYEAIQTESAQNEYPSEHSQHPENRAKNRYLNIIAYDHSRVHLLPIPGQKKALDYLNANYIDGFQCARAYIGTQGPLPATFDCFWRMVWEQRVAIIVMITNLVERGRRKCDMYWPKEGTETYGVIQVKLIKEDIMATYTVRTFKIKHLRIKKKKSGVAEKVVYQYHYTNWPDHGTPDHPLPVLHFVKKSSSANPPDAGPIIVHCSAGVGRTGTYIVLDAMLKQIRAKGEVNVFGFLRHIRTQRNFLVQTEEQYIFIHDALVEAIASGEDTNIARADIAAHVQALQAPDQLGQPWKLLMHQFKLITSFQCKDFNLVSAHKTVNQPKNRNKDTVPMENSRVHLTPRPGEDGSDYINATWLQGFHNLREFIITQHPVQETILNFWQMAWDHNVQTIVLLSVVDNQEYPVFWPTEDSTIDAENYKVKLMGEQSHSSYIIREFTMQSLQDDYELHVRMLQCSGWPQTCPSIATVFDLPNTVQSSLLEYQNGPVLIVDKFGGTEAATFCCLTTLAKHLAYDGRADVYMYAKLYHNKRPGIWTSHEDYLRLHLALQALSPTMGATPDLYASANGCVVTTSNGSVKMQSSDSVEVPAMPSQIEKVYQN